MRGIVITSGSSLIASDELTSTLAEVLAPYTAGTSDSDSEVLAGTMPDNSGWTTVEAQNGTTVKTVYIPYGYQDGTGFIQVKTLAEQTQGTATAKSVLKNKTCWVNGQKITGTAGLG